MREKPSFNKKDPVKSKTKNDDLWGCLLILWIYAIGNIVYLAISSVLSGRGGNTEYTICLGALICLAIAVILVKRNKKKEKQRLREAQQEWKSTCISEEVVIVSRQNSSYESYFDDYGDYHSNRAFHYLNLEITADQKAVNPNLTCVTVDVYQDIYKKLENRNTVRVYYKPDAPLTFLLEEEF